MPHNTGKRGPPNNARVQVGMQRQSLSKGFRLTVFTKRSLMQIPSRKVRQTSLSVKCFSLPPSEPAVDAKSTQLKPSWEAHTLATNCIATQKEKLRLYFLILLLN